MALPAGQGSSWRFRPRAVPTIGAAFGVLLFASLGTWQVRRRAEAEVEREAYAARLSEPPFDAARPPAEMDRRIARVDGTPDWDRYVLVTGQYMWNLPGYDLVVPVRGEGATVLVDVGWVPADGVEAALQAERALGPQRHFEGLARVYPEDPAAEGTLPLEPDGFRRYWRSWSPAMGQGTPVAPFVVFDGPGLAEGERNPDEDPPVAGWSSTLHQRPHGEYALTWFAILALVIGTWIYGSVVPATSGSDREG